MLLEEPRLAAFALTHRSPSAVYQEYLRRRSLREPWITVKALVLGKPDQTFLLDGRTYRYFFSETNQTWYGERCVELAIARAFVEANRGQRMLEVGNVLSQYGPRPDDYVVVDRYEHRPGVVNLDITEFVPPARFDAIISVSTVEHIGFDERPRDDGKVGRALAHLRTLLAPGGRCLITAPVGYNPTLDALFDRPTGVFDSLSFLRRISLDGTWLQQDWAQVQGAWYGGQPNLEEMRSGRRFPSANAIAVGILDGPPR